MIAATQPARPYTTFQGAAHICALDPEASFPASMLTPLAPDCALHLGRRVRHTTAMHKGLCWRHAVRHWHLVSQLRHTNPKTQHFNHHMCALGHA